jgi:hypothetical protein
LKCTSSWKECSGKRNNTSCESWRIRRFSTYILYFYYLSVYFFNKITPYLCIDCLFHNPLILLIQL